MKVRSMPYNRGIQLWNPANLQFRVNKYAIIREAEREGLTGFDVVAFLDKKPRTLQPGEWLLVF